MKRKNDMSLVSLIRDNPDYIDRIQAIAEEVRKDKGKITAIAQKYNKRYGNEIAEGTKRKQVLLTEGMKYGKSKAEVEQSMGFIPSIYTPILNWLYFFMREEDIPQREMLREEQESKYKHLLHEGIEVDGMNKVPEVFVILSGKNISYDKFKTLKKLKTLSKSQNNEHEAFNAYTQCLKLCNKYDIEFDSIPK
jgi:hypothetical protein